MKKKSILVFFLILALVILISGCTSTIPTTGTIEVNSTPAGAKIYLDGVDTGMATPFTITDVEAGSHVIKLDAFHYQIWEETVIVVANETKYLNPLLTYAPPQHITLQPDPIVGVDAQVYSAVPSTNYGDLWFSSIGNSGSTITRMYIKFYLSAVPANARIVGAYLNLYQYHTSGSNNFTTGLYRVTDDWDESTITWNLQPDSSTDAEITNNITAGAGIWESWWDLDTLVQGWLDGSITNYGMVLKDTNETSVNNIAYFYTSDYTGDVTERPKLEIEYYIP
ncbi:MAG: DNRLRE domain-containing protein [Candidatus Atribacteria bacterium]|nr:DNRLRE domain-containing protein [Candidatus Atribacteria bacterium]